jgi:probable phosphoglycerate mutase
VARQLSADPLGRDQSRVAIYLLRHGETEWSRADRKQGRADSPLTPLGVKQVQACARLLASSLPVGVPARLITSPLGRARASAEIVRSLLGLPETSLSVSTPLAEHDYGAWAGLTNAGIEERFPGQLARRRQDHWNYVVPGGESYALLAQRVGEWLSGQNPDQIFVVIAHDMVSRVLRGLYLELPTSEILRLTHHPHTRIHLLDRGHVGSLDVEPVSAT